MNFQEKRTNLRYPVQLPIDFGRTDYFMSSLCANLSKSGLYLETSEAVDVGNKVTIFITFPHRSEPLKVLGKVVWKRQTQAQDMNNNSLAGLGVHFIGDLPDELHLPEGFSQYEPELEAVAGQPGRRIPRSQIN